MLRKVIHIKGVGKFTDYSVKSTPEWNGEFKPITLIYGENGSGKTTFTSILKSLKENDALLYQLRTFGTESSPKVSIKFDSEEKPIQYSNAEWDKNLPNIEISDIHFINENVYTGFEILPQHKKNLFEIIIGGEGIRLKKEILEIKVNIKDKNSLLKDIENKILEIVNGFEVQTIIHFQFDNEIGKKISAKQKEIETAKASEKIQQTSPLNRLNKIDYGIRFEKVNEFFQTTIDTISEEYLKMVEDHKDSLTLKNKSEQWLKDGYENIVKNRCPFCLREFDNTVKIINAYNQYFNEQYISLQEKTKLLKNKVDTLNPELVISEIEKQLNYNGGFIEFWKNYIVQEIAPIDIEEHKTIIIEQTKKLIEIVDEKASNPIQVTEIDAVNALKVSLTIFNSTIEDYNIQIDAFNTRINDLKKQDAKDVKILENELSRLQAIQTRHTNENVIKLCKNYSEEIVLLEKLKDKNTSFQVDLKKYSRQTFDRYKNTINSYLQKFASYLEIREMKSTYKGGGSEPFAEYGLFVSGNKIRFKDDSINPSVKYCLSEGDKSALALSFFLAKLNTDENIENSIIVFDDPISSFDIHRKGATIVQLLNFGQKANQLIILTHNLLFAKDFWEKVKNHCQTLQFVELRKSVRLIQYDLEQETLNGLFKDYSVLDNYLTNGVATDMEKRNVARCIRPILEGYLRIKFYGEFSTNEWLGEFIEKIEQANHEQKLFRLKDYCYELIEIKDFGKKFHHTNPNSDSEPVYDGELKNYVERTFDLISKI
nr:AAA family ATPase [Bacteroidota bacterium]